MIVSHTAVHGTLGSPAAWHAGGMVRVLTHLRLAVRCVCV